MRVLAFPMTDTYTGNPYPELLYRNVARAGIEIEDFTFRRALFWRYDVLHLHWPDSHLRSTNLLKTVIKHGRLALILGAARLRGTRIVWTLHNLEPHDRNSRFSQSLFSWWFVRSLTHTIALSEMGRQRAFARYPVLQKKPNSVIRHGHYRPAYPKLPSKCHARARLDIPEGDFCFLFFGAIRPYKQVTRLIEEFRRLQTPGVRLLVIGKPFDGKLADQIKAAAAGDDRITLRLELIPEEEVPCYFRAADVFVAPFEHILNSGSAMLALSLDLPVLVPRAGSLEELAVAVGGDWVTLYDGLFLSQHLEQAHTRYAGRLEGPQPDLSDFDWEPIADLTVEHYHRQSA